MLGRICMISLMLAISSASTFSLADERERRIALKDDHRCPLKISSVKAKGKQIDTSKPFIDGDDWLRGLTVEVVNPSELTVTFVQVELFFPHPDKKPGASFTIDYGDNPFRYNSAAEMPLLSVKPVLPGGNVELGLTDAHLPSIASLLQAAEIKTNDYVRIRVNLIGFSDGTAWTGQMAQRNPKGGWMPLR